MIPGDGIGPEVTASARDTVMAGGAAVEFEEVAAGMREGGRTGTPLPAAVFDSIARNKADGPLLPHLYGDIVSDRRAKARALRHRKRGLIESARKLNPAADR